ncbi:MAG: dTDP-4-dehydrorhamnose reductase [Candidatus Nanopelagicales bacterium]|nr:dTDP-4-dehydrorhamnose reductase [Candidatus Nanopelagicales bacterium]
MTIEPVAHRPDPFGRWLVIGAAGMLGTEVTTALAGREVTALDVPEVDITDERSAARAVDGHDVVVNCAAWTAVDEAEAREADAFRVNATGVANLAAAARDRGAWMLHVSTDYVFAGDAREPYPEDALLDPRSAYGRTKAAGEWALRSLLPDRSILLRTAWLYGTHGPNFVRTMARLAAGSNPVDVVDDQIGQPTWARDLAGRLVECVDAGVPAGVYHGTNSGRTSWFGFAREIFSRVGADPGRVRQTTTDRFPRPAQRPSFSVLGHAAWHRVGLAPMPEWEDAFDRALASGMLAESAEK